MCGIVGVVGSKNATDILMQGLEKLEYRGYDSAGIFVNGQETAAKLVKSVGRIADLRGKLGLMFQEQLALVTHVGLLMVNQRKTMLIHILQHQVALF